MRIGVAQISCRPGEVSSNVEKMLDFTARARSQGCAMVVFPEMADTGYHLKEIPRTASQWDGGPFQKLQRAATENSIAIAAGLSEVSGKKIYNSAVLFDSCGNKIASYRKTHLFSCAPVHENELFTAGDSFCLAACGGWKTSILVCYDLRFPEAARTVALEGAELLLLPSAWPTPRSYHFETLARARAIENQVYVVCANRVGKDGSTEFCGGSCIIDPIGKELVKAGKEEGLLCADIDKGMLAETRKFMPVLRQRRKDLYQL